MSSTEYYVRVYEKGGKFITKLDNLEYKVAEQICRNHQGKGRLAVMKKESAKGVAEFYFPDGEVRLGLSEDEQDERKTYSISDS